MLPLLPAVCHIAASHVMAALALLAVAAGGRHTRYIHSTYVPTYCTDAFSHVTASNVKSLAFQASITDASMSPGYMTYRII